ncbi:MAG TPA: hypothetical protein VKM94_09710, partial [Blastocatellia bacterium]|nr:hypothetical protein [Blastocatellia bacterium]
QENQPSAEQCRALREPNTYPLLKSASLELLLPISPLKSRLGNLEFLSEKVKYILRKTVWNSN